MIVTYYGGEWHIVTRDGATVCDIEDEGTGAFTVKPGPNVTVKFSDGITIQPEEPHVRPTSEP